MAAPTSTFSSGAGTITATTEDNGRYQDVNANYSSNARVHLGVADAGTGSTLVFRGRISGLSGYYFCTGRSLKTGLPIDPTGFSPASGEKFEFDVSGCDRWEIYASALSSGTVSLEQRTFPAGANNPPIVQNASSGNAVFSAGVTLNGTTGNNGVSFPDNLANAFEFKEGSNSYLKGVSTDSAERMEAGKPIYQRDGNSPVVKKTATTVSTAGAGTLTAAAILGGIILRDPTGGDRTDTTHTAAQLVAALPGVAVSDTVDFMIVNTADAAETITLAGGSGVTLVPTTITIAQNEIFRGTLRFTNVTGSSEACVIYGGNVAG